VAFNVFSQLPLRKRESAIPGAPAPTAGSHGRMTLTIADADTAAAVAARASAVIAPLGRAPE
jgi:hypothetical protein